RRLRRLPARATRGRAGAVAVLEESKGETGSTKHADVSTAGTTEGSDEERNEARESTRSRASGVVAVSFE
ncbi:hypothetical protein, partial [Natronomonas sp.]|uniref:hypothetical protein n=1 Tax=Natronomonas sp. TaxID=2184060 RepID=UPI002FC31B30